MKLTIREVIAKIHDIEAAIRETEKATANTSNGYGALPDAADLLEEYRTKILDTVVDI
jgi:hypothetical protein